MADLKKALQGFNDWFRIEPRLAEYEAFAWRIIGEAGFPTTWLAFVEAFNGGKERPPEKVRIANKILFHVKIVKDSIKGGNPEKCALEMMRLCNEGFNLNFQIMLPTFERGEKFEQGPKRPRSDALSEAMTKTFLDFAETYGRQPTAQELWAALPEQGTVQEKDPDDQSIFWKRSESAG